eukprot:scaffold45678_cov199-Amphora_coffeaeformis.AAC.1
MEAPPQLKVHPNGLHNAVAAVKRLLRQHGYVLLRGLEDMTALQMKEFMQQIAPGQFMIPFDDEASASLTKGNRPAHVPGVPQVRILGQGHDNALLANVGYEWHQDGGGTAPFLTLLHCKDPCQGADTLFADGAVLFDRLSESDKDMARSLIAVYSNEYTGGGPTALDAEYGLRMSPCGTKRIRSASRRKSDWKPGRFERTVVEVGTDGRERLLAGAKGLEFCRGYDTQESSEMLSALLRSALDPIEEAELDEDLLPKGITLFSEDAVYVHKWKRGEAMLWDNFRVIHSTTPTCAYKGKTRLMWQIISKAEAMMAPESEITT